MASSLMVSVEALRVFKGAGFRCVRLREFAYWHEGAVGPFRAGTNGQSVPGSARQFCADCPVKARRRVVKAGKCIRAEADSAKKPLAGDVTIAA